MPDEELSRVARLARELRTSEQSVTEAMSDFIANGLGMIVIRIQMENIDDQIREKQRKLETCSGEDVKLVQGQIAGLRLAKELLLTRP